MHIPVYKMGSFSFLERKNRMTLMQRNDETLIQVTTTVQKYGNLKSLIKKSGGKVYKSKYNRTMAKVWKELDTVGIHGNYQVDDIFKMIEERIIFPCEMQSVKKIDVVNDVEPLDLTADKEENKEKEKYSRLFIRSNIIFIDVDKYDGDIDAEYEKGLKNLSIGYVHSPSGDNCYRLAFILDSNISDYEYYKVMHKFICNMLKQYDFANCIDSSNSSPLALIRIGKGYKYFNKQARVAYTMYLEDITNEVFNRFATQYVSEDSNYRSGIITTDIEVNERLRFMGNKKTDYDTWFAMVQAIRSRFGSNEEAKKAIRIASEDRKNYCFETDLESIFNDNKIKYDWGTFIKISNKFGYRPSYKVTAARREAAKKEGALKENYPTNIHKVTKIKIDERIELNTIVDLLNSDEITLLDSPTNSGKSTTTLDAFKSLAEESSKNIFIMSVPTTSIIDNLIRDDAELVGYYAAKEDSVFRDIVGKALMLNKRQIYITTYDATYKMVKFILHSIPDANIRIVVDEAHEWVQAYNYRDAAIKDLAHVLPYVRIALSGTAYPVDMSSIFNKRLICVRDNDKINADEYNVYTFKNDGEEAIYATINAIYQPLKRGNKVLLFVDNIENGLVLADKVKEKLPNIRTTLINADNKNENEVYKRAIKTGKFFKEVDLVIATRFLSSGVSIENSYNSHIYILSSQLSNMRDTVLLRQSAARFRNQYKSINLIIQETNEEEKRPYNYAGAVSNTMYYANQQYERVQKYQMRESMFGVIETTYHVTKDGIDELAVRHDAMYYQSRYYAIYRRALSIEFSRVLNLPINNVVDVTPKVEIHTKEERGRKEKETREEREERMSEFKEVCKQEVIDRAKQGDKDSIDILSSHLNKNESTTMSDILHIVKQAEDIYSIVSKTKIRNQIYQYTTYLDNLLEMEKIDKNSSDFIAIQCIENKLKEEGFLLTTSGKEILINETARKVGVSIPVINKIIKNYFIKNSSNQKKKQERAAEYVPANSQMIGLLYDIKETEVIRHKEEYRYQLVKGSRKRRK